MFCDPSGEKAENSGRKVITITGEDEDSNNHCFESNVETFKKDHPNDEVYNFNAWEYNSAKDLMNAIIKKSKELEGIDALVIESHGTPQGNAFMAGNYQLDGNAKWDKIKFNEGASIRFSGCRIGGSDGEKNNDSLAQKVANKTGCTVYAFVNKTSQKAYDVNGNVTTNINSVYKTYQKPVKSVYGEKVSDGCIKFVSERKKILRSNFGMYG